MKKQYIQKQFSKKQIAKKVAGIVGGSGVAAAGTAAYLQGRNSRISAEAKESLEQRASAQKIRDNVTEESMKNNTQPVSTPEKSVAPPSENLSGKTINYQGEDYILKGNPTDGYKFGTGTFIDHEFATRYLDEKSGNIIMPIWNKEEWKKEPLEKEEWDIEE